MQDEYPNNRPEDPREDLPEEEKQPENQTENTPGEWENDIDLTEPDGEETTPSESPFSSPAPQGGGNSPYHNDFPPYHIPGTSPEAIRAAQKKKQRRKKAITIVAITASYLLLVGLVIFLLARENGNVARPSETGEVPVSETEEETHEKNNPINGEIDDNGKSHIKNDDYTGEALTAKELYAENVESVVYIKASNNLSASSGSGFVIDAKNGYILTNCHVVDGATDIGVVLKNGDEYKATLVGGDDINDVAVLKIGAQNLRAVNVGNSDDLSVGDDILVIGNPLNDLNFTLTKGIVSGLDRIINTGENSMRTFQTDAAVNPGNSGGPAFDATGAVVGILSAKYESAGIEGLGFCIPINDAMKIARDLVDYGYVKGRPTFGITVSTSQGYTTQYDSFGRRVYTEATPGALIQAVNKGSAADKAGLKPGDIVTKLDTIKITSSNDLIAAKNNFKAGDTVKLVIDRNGETLELSLTFDEYVPEKPSGNGNKS